MSAEAIATFTTCLLVTPGTARGFASGWSLARLARHWPGARPSPVIPQSAPRHVEAVSVHAEPDLAQDDTSRQSVAIWTLPAPSSRVSVLALPSLRHEGRGAVRY